MPHLSGQATLRELRRIDARVKVILSSGFNEAEATLSFEDGELAGFLQKPYSGASLANRVSSALRG
jgi:DNA-binding NarL/FixJ family response regulator